MIEKPNIKEIAEFFRIGLRVGLSIPSNIVRWADAIILAEDKPDISIIEVSLAGGRQNKMIDALRDVKGEIRPDYLIKLMLAYCLKHLKAKQGDADSFTGLLYRLKCASDVSEDMDYTLTWLDDELYLAREQILGTVEQSMDEIISFLKSFEEYEQYLPDEIYSQSSAGNKPLTLWF